MMSGTTHDTDVLPLILHGLSTVFDSLGRSLICLGPDFRIVHGAGGLERLAGPGAVEALLGKAAEEVFGPELFGADGTLRRALAAGERREGWGAVLRMPGGRNRQVSLTVAPILPDTTGMCDSRVAYVVVLRPVQDGEEIGDGAAILLPLEPSSSPQERQKLLDALSTHHWRRDATARALGISRTTLWRKMRELDL